MKRLLMLLLLVPAAADACHVPTNIVETWSTYCDGGVEKVRLTLTFHVGTGADFSEHGSEFGIAPTIDSLDGCPGHESPLGTVTYLGDDYWKVVHQGWPRDCVPGDTLFREGTLIVFYCIYGGGAYSDAIFLRVYASDGPQPIVDTVDCSPLPIASTTWGAIKALYR